MSSLGKVDSGPFLYRRSHVRRPSGSSSHISLLYLQAHWEATRMYMPPVRPKMAPLQRSLQETLHELKRLRPFGKTLLPTSIQKGRRSSSSASDSAHLELLKNAWTR